MRHTARCWDTLVNSMKDILTVYQLIVKLEETDVFKTILKNKQFVLFCLISYIMGRLLSSLYPEKLHGANRVGSSADVRSLLQLHFQRLFPLGS